MECWSERIEAGSRWENVYVPSQRPRLVTCCGQRRQLACYHGGELGRC